MWKEHSRYKKLWENVEVKLVCYRKCPNEVAALFVQHLPKEATVSLKINFIRDTARIGLSSEVLFSEVLILKFYLRERCPHLHTLSFRHASFSRRLYWIIDSCGKYLPNLKELILQKCMFGDEPTETSVGHLSQIELLEVSFCQNVGNFTWCLLAKLPYLKKLNMQGLSLSDWIEKDYSRNFLGQLEALHLGWASLDYHRFAVLCNRATNLTVLFLCCMKGSILWNRVFHSRSLLNLQKLCLRGCSKVIPQYIVAFKDSHPPLQTIYVDQELAASYYEIPKVCQNSELAIVQPILSCENHKIT